MDKPADNIKNYHSIAFISVLSKIMEKIITSRLTWFLESNVNQAINDSLDKRLSVLATFIDLNQPTIKHGDYFMTTYNSEIAESRN